MRNDLFYKQIKENALNKPVIGIFEKYANTHADFQMYIITAPLGEKYEYQYEDRALIVLVPSHKLLFINLSDEEESFLDYVEDVIQDLNSMSDKYKYQDFIGRARKWKDEIVEKVQYNDANFDLEDLFAKTKLHGDEARKADLLISLLTGSINDIEKIGAVQPTTLLEKVKKNIILFDGEQTRFIFI